MSSKLKQIFYGIDDFNSKIKNLLFTYGRNKILDIYIYRKPINNMIKNFLNLLSLNQIKENLEKYSYDDIYHLFMIIKTENDLYFLIEKNEIVNLGIVNINSINNLDKVEYIKIDYNKELTLIELIQNSIKKIGSYNFFNYDSRNLNCQKFTLDMLSSSNLMKDEYKNFIYQKPYEIYEKTGILSSINKGITNVGSTIKIISGSGIKKEYIDENKYDNLINKNKFKLYCIKYNLNYFNKNKNEILKKMNENKLNIDNYRILKNKYIMFFNNIDINKLDFDNFIIKDFNKQITLIYYLKK